MLCSLLHQDSAACSLSKRVILCSTLLRRSPAHSECRPECRSFRTLWHRAAELWGDLRTWEPFLLQVKRHAKEVFVCLFVRVVNHCSGLAVTFSTLTPSTCNVTGSVVTFFTVGTCTFRASQSGTSDYLAANNDVRVLVRIVDV